MHSPGGRVSVRDQERRQKESERRLNEVMERSDREVRLRIEQRAKEASLRADEVIRRIEKGDVEPPRPLPGMREDSMESMESMPSMKSMESMKSLESADYANEVSEEVKSGEAMGSDMPLQGVVPYDPQSAEADLAQRVTEETGSGGDVHQHAEQKADEMAQEMTDDTGAGGDMEAHAARKVEQMGQEMFEE
jgi:hypothetical protein